MERPLVPPARPIHEAVARGLFLACALLFAWAIYLTIGSERSIGESAPTLLVPIAAVLGTGGMTIGDRYPRLRWALLIGSIALSLIAIFVLRSRLLTK